MLWERLEKHRDIGLLVLRLGFGLAFIWFHGWGKISGGPERWAGIGDSMELIGIGFGFTFFGFLAALAESLGALFIAAGFLFRPACAALAFTMFIASSSHLITGNGSPGHAIKNLFVASGLVLIGPGKYSVDSWLANRKEA